MADEPALDFTGRVVLVTGAGGGIGVGIAQAFVDAGARVVAAHRRTEPRLDGPAESWLAVAADLVDDDAPDRLVAAAIDRFGRLDAVVNNAGAQDLASLAGMTDAEFTSMLDTNLVAVHRLTQAAVDALEATSGSVVHVASIEGTTPAPGHAHYAVSKAGVIMHARAAALEYGPRGVRVNAVSPGLIDRSGLDADWPEGVARWQAAAPLGRLGTPRDVANACLFLCSPLAAWITGVNLVVDGGVETHPHW